MKNNCFIASLIFHYTARSFKESKLFSPIIKQGLVKMAYNNSRNPLRALSPRIGTKISIRLKDGTQYHGILKEYDSFMNLILHEVQEFIEGVETSKYEELFVRGNNVLFIEPTVKEA